MQRVSKPEISENDTPERKVGFSNVRARILTIVDHLTKDCKQDGVASVHNVLECNQHVFSGGEHYTRHFLRTILLTSEPSNHSAQSLSLVAVLRLSLCIIMASKYPVAEPVAIIGSSCRLPGGASSPSKLWTLLQNPRDLLSEIPPSRFNAKAFYHEDPEHHGVSLQRSHFTFATGNQHTGERQPSCEWRRKTTKTNTGWGSCQFQGQGIHR